MKAVPFRLNRNDVRPLVDQLTDELRHAIDTGYWKPGEYLPGRDAFAEEFGVSVSVPRGAFSKLIADGYIRSRPRLGCQVMDRKGRAWRGDVLLAQRRSDGAYYLSRLYDEIQSGLLAAGYLVTRAVVESLGRGREARQYMSDLLSRRYDLVLSNSPSAFFRAETKRFGSPLVPFVFAVRSCRRTAPTIVLDRTGAFGDFADRCRARGISRVDVVAFGSVWRDELVAALNDLGIESVPHEVDLDDGATLFDVERAGYEATRAVFADGMRPQLVFFADDYLARGGFTALDEIAADVPVVCWTNRGFEPFATRPYARFEMDPLGDAELIVRHLERILTRKSRIGSLVLSPRFIDADTPVGGLS